MILSCKILVPWGYDWTLFSRFIETVDLGSVRDKNAAHRGGEFGNWPLGRSPAPHNTARES